MNKTLIAAAIAAFTAPAAFALAPSAGTPDAVIYAGGGSAQAKAVIYAIDSILSNVDIYSQDGCNGKSDSKYDIFYGNLKTAAGSLAAGAKVLVYYKFNGGSFPNGVVPQQNASVLPYPTSLSSSTACSGQTYPLPTFSIPASPTSNFVPDWGLSDEEPKLLNASVNSGSSKLASLSNISATGMFVNIVGVAVSNSVYQSGTTNGSCAKTNFTKAEVNAILTGGITDWSQLQGDSGCTPAAGAITLLDRTAGSGTKAAGNIYFLNNGNPAPPANSSTSNVSTNATCSASNAPSGIQTQIINEGSSGSVVSDLNTNGCREVAILGGEFPPSLNSPGNYSFASIDGIDPGLNGLHPVTLTYANVINGKYDFVFTTSFNNRTASVTSSTSSTPQHWVGDGTAFSTLITRVKTALQSNALPGGTGLGNTLSPSGLLLDPNIAPAFSACVVRGTRFGDSTAPYQLFYDYSNALPGSPTGCNDNN